LNGAPRHLPLIPADSEGSHTVADIGTQAGRREHLVAGDQARRAFGQPDRDRLLPDRPRRVGARLPPGRPRRGRWRDGRGNPVGAAAAPRHPGRDQRRPAAEMAGLAPQGRLKKGRWGVALRGPPGLRLGRTRRNCPPSVTGRHRMRVGSNAKPPSIRRRQVRRACARARCRPRHDFSRLGARSSGSRSPRPRGCARPVAVRASRAWLRNARVCASAITTSGSTKLLKGGDRPHEAETARS
jgi:hypothetical protein